jgi:hypothetical protein
LRRLFSDGRQARKKCDELVKSFGRHNNPGILMPPVSLPSSSCI